MTHTGAVARRAVGRLLLAAPLSGAALLLAAAPASAAITTPGAGTTYTANTTIGISASVPASGTQSVLTLVSPDNVSRELARTTRANQISNYSTALSGDLDTECASADCSPGQVKPARNGTWTVKLTGAQSDTQTFVLRIAPRAPFEVTATTTAEREITVGWKRGAEPDLTGFTLYDASGAVLRSGLTTAACSGASCSTVVSYGADDTGERSFALRSHRTEAPGSNELVDSAQSGTATANLAAKPAPTPEPTQEPGSTGGDPGTTGGEPGTTGSGSGSTGSGPSPGATGGTGTTGSSGGSTGSGGSDTGGTTSGSTSGVAQPGISTGSTSDTRAIEQRRAFALTFRSFNPKLGISKLPPLPKSQPPVVGEAELEDGTFEESLGFEDREVQEKYEILGSKRIGGAVTGALDSEQFMRFIAVAMVLLLTAAHLRRWLGATAAEE